jgi:K+-transporting ATPase ATPase C chain
MSHIRPAILLLLVFTLLTGVAYPFAVTGIAQALFPAAANTSLVADAAGTVIGSEWVGQNFTHAGYLHPRPSATSGADPADPSKTIDMPYNAAASTGSNLGPTSQKLADRLRAGAEALRSGGITGPLPADAITASGSGLDPDVSPAFAFAQAARIAAARGVEEARVRAIIAAHVEGPMLGLFGEPRVNVLRVNLALDAGTPRGPG